MSESKLNEIENQPDIKEAQRIQEFSYIFDHEVHGFCTDVASVWAIPKERLREIDDAIAHYRKTKEWILNKN
jgi:hypothetical protein